MDPDFIRELFAEFGEVSIKRMFGGQGLYAGSLMFGLVADAVIYLKADETTSPAYAAENCAPFGFETKHGRRVLTSYWRLPDRLYDEPAELAQWARSALAVAKAKKAANNKAMKKPAPRGPAKKIVARRKARR
jgi:DNA transformation protein and related proteins